MITPLFILFLLGLLVGSFLNVVIFRVEHEESFVQGRSRCFHCERSLSWYENIPLISFVFLRGQCRTCKGKISWQYPVVEAGTAVLFASSSFLLRLYQGQEILVQVVVAALLLLLLSFVILIAVYDIRFSLIPDTFLWGLNVSTLLLLVSYSFFHLPVIHYFPPSLSSSLLGALVAGGFFYFLVFLSKETWMGWGDVWLGVWGGMLLGIELTQIFITLSFSLGAVVGLTLLYQKKKTLKAEVPFAPYILASGLLLLFAMFLDPDIIRFLSPWLPGTIE